MRKNKDLRYFLSQARETGADFYVKVKKPLEPDLQVCVLQEKLAAHRRFPVMFCPKIKGSQIPLVTNLMGSYELLGMALGMNLSEHYTQSTDPDYFAFSDNIPQKIDRVKLTAALHGKTADKRKTVTIPPAEAPVKEVILKGEDVDLGILPLTRHGMLDSTKYITIGCTISKHPDTGIPNVGIYRHEVKGKNKLGLGTHPGHHIAYIARRHAELKMPMEVAIFIGHHPAVILGSQAEGAIDLNEMEVMSGLLGEPLLVTSAETVDLEVPAWAEIIIEGVLDPTHTTIDGPFAEYTGYYGEKGGRTVYIMNVTAITMRKDAIFHDLDPGHREHSLLHTLFRESAVYEAVKKVVPTLQAVNLPLSACCSHHIYLSIKKRIQGEGKLAAMAALTAFHNNKVAIVVDDDIDVYDEQQVLWAVATRVRADKNISMIPGVAASELDPTSYDETGINRGHMNTKLIIDATRPVTTPFSIRLGPPEDLWKSMKMGDYVDDL